MVTSKDNIRSDNLSKPPKTSGSPRLTVDETVLALARLLGRQAAREAIRAERYDAQIPDPAPITPLTTVDEE